MSAVVILNDFGATEVLAVTATAADFVMDRPGGNVIVWSDRSIHLKHDTSATTDDFRLEQGDYARVLLLTDDTLSFITADSEPDGVVRITRIG